MNEDLYFKSAAITGTGTADMDIETGFKPRRVTVTNYTDAITYENFEGMTDAYMLKRIADGTLSEVTAAGLTLSDGDAGEIALVEGTVAITIGSAALTGTSTFFPAELKAEDTIRVDGYPYKIMTVDSDTSCTLYSKALTTTTGDSLVRVNGRSAGVTLGTAVNIDAKVFYVEAWR